MLRHLNATSERPARAVVIGAGGFVGNAIASRLERDGIEVLRITRREVDLLAADASEQLGRLLAPGDTVIAAAAIAPCKNPEMLCDNMSLALAIARALAAGAPAHVVNISSDAVYVDAPVPLTESSLAAPETLHGVMHLARELMLKAALSAPLAILRPSLLYGAGDPHNGYGPNRFRRLANRGEPIVLFGDGEERRDHVLIEDLAELVARVVARRSVGILNIATGETASFRDLAAMATAAAGKHVPITGSPRQGPMPHNGYRPFATDSCRAAFPDFAYTPLAAGIMQAQRAEFGPA